MGVSQKVKDNCRKLKPRRAKFRKKNKVISVPSIGPIIVSKQSSLQMRTRKKHYNKFELLELFLPNNLKYMVFTPNSPFYYKSIKSDPNSSSDNGVITMPKIFSLVDNPIESIVVIRRVVNALLFENNHEVIFDYSQCTRADIGAQALMDVILMEYNKFGKRCSKVRCPSDIDLFPVGFGGRNIKDEHLKTAASCDLRIQRTCRLITQ